MIDTHTQLQELIQASVLTKNEADEFIQDFNSAEDEDIEIIVKLFNEDTNWINWLYQNYKHKKGAFIDGDTKEYRKILDKESAIGEALHME